MKVICAWCQRDMGEKPREDVTHGVCETCFKGKLKEIHDGLAVALKPD